ncbi:MAG: sulfite exporter TauE/SafE family protein [Pseudomonadota bacterium]
MTVPIEFLLVAGIVVVIVGISKSGFAGGLGVIAVPVMTLYVSPQMALAIQMPLLILMDFANGWRYWKSWSRPVVMALLPGAFLGLAAGAALFNVFDGVVLKALIGLMAVFMAAQFFLGGAKNGEQKIWRRPFIILAGFVSGFAGIVAHAGGPAVKGYLLSQNMDKTTFVGTNSMFFLFLNLVKGVIYGAMSQYTAETLQISLMLIPFLVLGVFLGFRLHKLISQRVFQILAFSLLGLAGVRLLVDVGLSVI